MALRIRQVRWARCQQSEFTNGKGTGAPRWDATRTVLHDKRRPGEAPTHAIDAPYTSQPSCAKPRGHRDWYQLEAWSRRAKLQLLHEPLCAYCLQRGLVVPAEIADHVERHGGDYTRFLT